MIAERARATTPRKNKTPVTLSRTFQCQKRHQEPQIHSAEAVTTSHSAETVTTSIFLGPSAPRSPPKYPVDDLTEYVLGVVLGELGRTRLH
jgi:hypothetical protein